MDDRVYCHCKDWKPQLYILENFVNMASARAGKNLFHEVGGKRFDYCPWCGQGLLPEQPNSASEERK